MTTVHISLGRDDGMDQTAAKGVVEWEPTTRREDGTMVILERGFVAPLVDGEATVIVDPSGLTWCWRVTERTDSGGTVRYVSVPDSAVVVEYVDLPDVDPDTFDHTAVPEAAWWAVAGSTVTSGEVVGDDLVLTRTDDTTVNAGNVRGPKGDQGDPGPQGPQGVQGPSGTLSGVSDGTLTTPQTGDAPVFNAVTGKWERVSLPSTYVAPTGTDDRLQVAGVDVTPEQVGAAPALGADDNYVTDAEKAALHSHANKTALDAVSGTNTGDQDLSGLLTTAAAPEVIRDTMGSALVAGANVTITPNDGADTITIAASGGTSLDGVTDATTTRLGLDSLAALTTGANNTAVGENAGYMPLNTATTTASNQTIVGESAGQNSASPAEYLTAVGRAAVGESYGTAVGGLAKATGGNATAIGYAATAGVSGAAFGRGAAATGANGVAFGYATVASGVHSVAIGHGVTASANGAVAIGKDSSGASASSSVTNRIALGTASHTTHIAGALTVLGAVAITLPTSDPKVAGRLWSDSGTVKVSAG